MQYFEDPDKKIQAGFALNAGKLLDQYQKIAKTLSESSRYDATLTICVLQSMLTNCKELLESMSKNQKGDWFEPLSEIPQRWGLKQIFVEKDTYPAPITYIRFITHLRDALSHPSSPDKKPNLPSTGYISLSDSSGLIKSFRFTESPWVDRGQIYSKYEGKDELKVKNNVSDFEKKYNCNLDVAKNDQGKFQVVDKEGSPYFPIFIAEISLKDLVVVTKELSNYLALPAQQGWDGKTIKQLVG
jgi:hypothetical protein